jgi:transposase
MSKERIERVDSLPLIIHWLLVMRVDKIIDAIWQPHGNLKGLSYGKLAVLFLAFILYMRNHRLSYVEEWSIKHRTTLEHVTGWRIRDKEMTDDRLGQLVEVLGTDEAPGLRYQWMQSQHLIQAYALPTEVVRYDTTTFSVYHAPDEDQGLFRFGHSKDQRPDLMQFKQGLGTLDPAGVPLLTATLPGSQADDPLYVPAWREMVHTIGPKDFLFVADCKAAALETRATIDDEDGYYLFPLPMTGEVPDLLRKWVLPVLGGNPPVVPQPIHLDGVTDEEGNPCPMGQGFEVERQMTAELADGTQHTWTERSFVTPSTAHVRRQREALRTRLDKATEKLSRMRVKSDESAPEFQARAEGVIGKYRVKGLLTVTVTETITPQKHYLRPGRPTSDTPYEMVEHREVDLHCHHNTAAIVEQMQLAGWRIYVTNVPAARMSQEQSVAYYRDQWTAERGYHRFKRGSVPALPIFLRIPARIKGLMLLLMIALQALTLLEFVAQRELAARGERVTGLVPGNPKMETERPSAERILAQFDHLHLAVEETDTEITGHLVESLTPLQCRLLNLLGVPETIYDLIFIQTRSAAQHKAKSVNKVGIPKFTLQPKY